jgi:hypothetical protein
LIEYLIISYNNTLDPNKVKSTSFDKNSSRKGSSGQHPRIEELSINGDEHNGAVDSSTQPIIEEPDDPPKIRRSYSDTQDDNYQQQQHSQAFFYNQARVRPSVFTMPAGYFHAQQQRFPNGFTHAPCPLHPHMHQQRFTRPQLFQQYRPTMLAKAMIVEELDHAQLSHLSDDVNGLINGNHFDAQEPLYMVTYDGRRSVMNEGQITQLLYQLSQQQAHLVNLQQQQQQYFRQQQQQQQYFQQQSTQQRF